MTPSLEEQLAALTKGFRARALGARENLASLELAPFGLELAPIDPVAEPRLVAQYARANQHAFGGPLALPGWVLTDVYLLPGAIALLTCDASELPRAARDALAASPGDEAIAAAYVALPTVTPGTVMGVSLLSLIPHRGLASAVKALGLAMLRAAKQRGVAQWGNRSLRAHTRMGSLRVLGPAPETHEHAGTSFVYEVDLADRARWAAHLAGTAASPGVVSIDVRDERRLRELSRRAYDGARIEVVPPGLSSDGTAVCLSVENA